jgi:hypothetical protein
MPDNEFDDDDDGTNDYIEGVCGVEKPGEERRAEVLEVMRPPSQHRGVGVDSVASLHRLSDRVECLVRTPRIVVPEPPLPGGRGTLSSRFPRRSRRAVTEEVRACSRCPARRPS